MLLQYPKLGPPAFIPLFCEVPNEKDSRFVVTLGISVQLCWWRRRPKREILDGRKTLNETAVIAIALLTPLAAFSQTATLGGECKKVKHEPICATWKPSDGYITLIDEKGVNQLGFDCGAAGCDHLDHAVPIAEGPHTLTLKDGSNQYRVTFTAVPTHSYAVGLNFMPLALGGKLYLLQHPTIWDNTHKRAVGKATHEALPKSEAGTKAQSQRKLWTLLECHDKPFSAVDCQPVQSQTKSIEPQNPTGKEQPCK